MIGSHDHLYQAYSFAYPACNVRSIIACMWGPTERTVGKDGLTLISIVGGLISQPHFFNGKSIAYTQ